MSVSEALPDTLLIGDLHFAVRESPRRSTVGITVDRDGSLQLHAPAGCPPDALAAWAHSKRIWVYRKLAEKDVLLSAWPVKEFVSGEGFAYLGRSHRLLITDTDQVRMERGRLLLSRAIAAGPDPGAALVRWYRGRGQRWLPGRIRPWADRMGLIPARVDVRDLGYRWGSLSANRRLNIHWATLQLPPSLIDYVLVHELTHLAHSQHTSAFWATVERAMPDYERRKADLLRAGARLWMG
ncbi:M48 family metallopeptidase [Catenuloplanes atrovinosus]|uniref:Metal-dependent hydrolase n=1 Tax=Catenuloplanes atrovinosus TaxID=137266 RepID=A0AAE3YU01_9ACTN|nr:SprT family zinc-dependent metalloprotease [Catenuloplanes atrovinosus]MDR7279908.1 putative metal-dependent hydrolase [Catenuloplanes atrovinosus]